MLAQSLNTAKLVPRVRGVSANLSMKTPTVFAIVQTVPDSLEINCVISQHTTLCDAGESLLATQCSENLYVVQQDQEGCYPAIVGECERRLTSMAYDAAENSL